MTDAASSRPAPGAPTGPPGRNAVGRAVTAAAGRGRAPAGAVRPRALREAVRRPTRAALVKDALLYGALALPVVAGIVSPLDPDRMAWWLCVGGLAVLAAAVAVSRARPTAALLTAMALIAVHGNFVFAMPVLAYLTGRRTIRAQPPLWAFTAVFVAGSALAIARGQAVETWFPSTVWLVLFGVLPWLTGRYWRQYQELLHAGWERAERLEHQQRIIAERERLRERARIAQDMHDSLGHELALIAVRAGALQVAPGLDDRHRDAAAQLRRGAAEATEHLREIIGVLREDTATGPGTPHGPDGLAPVRPPHESIGDLVERARASGVPVHLTGTAADLPELAPMAALTAHRVVQEAVTNAAKHAPGAAVTVHLTRRDPPAGDAPHGGGVTVTVTNGPPPGRPAPSAPGGTGLAALTERVRVLGGTLHAGPAPGGGFEVTADLPGAPPAPRAFDSPADPSGGHRAAPTAAPTAGTALRAALGLTRTPPGEWPSESARHLARERRQVRRGLITAITVPAALMAALGTVMAAYYAYVTLNSVLPPADYAALRVGAPQASVQRTLPPRETMGAGTVRRLVPEPARADCRYYRPEADLLGVSRIYRLCFTGGRLTAKDAYDTTLLSAEHDRQRNPP
ncbi:sensor histidine kinase [Actinomadura livida]|uniref:sensor histidine kinase n=1 Tax=Actinomadura livida TaxID=79909 RepID=UPI0019C68808|nr:histidine kinase [Actinomadura livida]GGT89562.1 two-component sensor histidine kinase [Actinomadura livida]